MELNMKNEVIVDRKEMSNNSYSNGEITKRSFADNFRAIFIVSTVLLLSTIILKEFDQKPKMKIISKSFDSISCDLGMNKNLQKNILKKHNEIRSKVALGLYKIGNDQFLPPASKMPKLEWDCNLEKLAKKRAESCILNQENEDFATKLEDIYGENAFIFRDAQYDPEHMNGFINGIEKMGEEISNIGIESIKLSRFDKRIGHATQIIWENTRRVGCAIQECSEGNEQSKYNLAICKYYPTGNVFQSRQPTPIYTESDHGGDGCSIGDPTSGLCIEEGGEEEQNDVADYNGEKMDKIGSD